MVSWVKYLKHSSYEVGLKSHLYAQMYSFVALQLFDNAAINMVPFQEYLAELMNRASA